VLSLLDVQAARIAPVLTATPPNSTLRRDGSCLITISWFECC
jgi:hypothetical protein